MILRLKFLLSVVIQVLCMPLTLLCFKGGQGQWSLGASTPAEGFQFGVNALRPLQLQQGSLGVLGNATRQPGDTGNDMETGA